MDNENVTYEQVMGYCKSRNCALVDQEFLHILLGDKPMELWGLPVEEVERVIKIYKYKGVVPTTEYTEGFEDGVEHTKKLYEKKMDDLIMNISYEKSIPVSYIENKIKVLKELDNRNGNFWYRNDANALKHLIDEFSLPK